MTDVTNYPMIDDFDTTLAQARDGAVGTVYLNDAVGITIPANTTTCIVVNPGKSTMQVAKINAVNNTLKTATVSSITVNKGAGVAYTQQSHPVGSVVRISTNYQFWKDMIDSINTKVDTNSDDIATGKFADATARDAYFTSPVNGISAYLIAEGKRTDYVAGSWVDRDQGTVTANASTTVAGKVEQSTAAQNTAGTATGETGAPLFSTPADLATTIQSGSWVYCASSTGSDTYTANLTPSLTAYTTGMLLPCKFTTTNTGACSININGLGAKSIKTKDGNDPQTGVIRANGTALLMYDGTNFVIQSEDFATATVSGIMKSDFQKYNFFGDGSDGDVTISSNTTLASDKFYNNLTINNGFTLNPGGYRIFVKGTLTNNGTIARNGNNGTNGGTATSGTGGSALANGTIYGSAAGTTGSSWSNGSGGGNVAALGNGQGVAGGNGGAGASAGFTGGTVTQERIIAGLEDSTLNTFLFDNGTDTIKNTIVFKGLTSGYTMIGSGSGGGGGGNGSSSSGGGGGGGSAGGMVYISALSIVNAGTISSNGGNGGNGGNGSGTNGGGGGGGGGGGPVLLVYGTLSNSGSITSTGGSAGTGGTGTPNGANGTAGSSNAICKIVII